MRAIIGLNGQICAIFKGVVYEPRHHNLSPLMQKAGESTSLMRSPIGATAERPRTTRTAYFTLCFGGRDGGPRSPTFLAKSTPAVAASPTSIVRRAIVG